MARLKQELLEWVESFCHRVVDLAEAVGEGGHSRRIVDQIIASGTSVGANTYEAAEAMTRADFVKCLRIAVKELSEPLFWIRFVVRRKWVRSSRTAQLEAEYVELKRLFGAMLGRTKRSLTKPAR